MTSTFTFLAPPLVLTLDMEPDVDEFDILLLVVYDESNIIGSF